MFERFTDRARKVIKASAPRKKSNEPECRSVILDDCDPSLIPPAENWTIFPWLAQKPFKRDSD